MKAIIAKIRLNAGNAGWYDQLSNIHLTVRKPFSNVYEGMNTANIKSGIRAKTIILEEGSVYESSSCNPGTSLDGGLTSPNGTEYLLGVNNNGALITKEVSKGVK